EIALGVADVGDGKLGIGRAAVTEHFTDQFEDAWLRPDDRLRTIDCRIVLFGGRRIGGQDGATHWNIENRRHCGWKTCAVATITFSLRQSPARILMRLWRGCGLLVVVYGSENHSRPPT